MRSALLLAAVVCGIMTCTAGKELVRRHYCGRVLAEAVAEICYGPLNMVKRAAGAPPRDSAPWPSFEPEPALRDSHLSLVKRAAELAPALSDSGAAALPQRYPAPWLWHAAAQAPRPPLAKRGIVDECCYNACTTDDLATYCD